MACTISYYQVPLVRSYLFYLFLLMQDEYVRFSLCLTLVPVIWNDFLWHFPPLLAVHHAALLLFSLTLSVHSIVGG